MQYPNLEFINQNAISFSSPETFDLITAFFSLNWIDQKELAFLRIAENLKSSGQALIVVPCEGESTQALYETHALNAGLEILYSKKQQREVVFQSSEEFKKWLRAILADLSQEKFDAFFEQHLHTIQKKIPQADDGRVYAFPYKLTLLLRKG